MVPIDFATCLGSEQMSLVQLIIPTEVAHDTVYELGELGDIQFKDVRPTTHILFPFVLIDHVVKPGCQSFSALFRR